LSSPVRVSPFVGAIAFALTLAAFVACNGGGGGASPTPGASPTAGPTGEPTEPAPTPSPAETPSPTASPSPSPEPTPTATPVPFEGTQGPVQGVGTAPVPPGALLVQVRYGRHENFDRIVFQFENGLPAYRIEYVEPPILGEFSGEPVAIAGDAFLRARFSDGAAHDPFTGDRTYLGPLELVPGLPELKEAEITGDFEGVLTWVLGLAEASDFRIYALEAPFRIVVDVGHP
jgi:hypothetical protein